MAARPSLLPIWNRNLGSANTRIPTASETADGLPAPGVVSRQVFNGLFGYLSLWADFFRDKLYAPSDLYDDQHLVPGFTPITTQSLAQVAGHLTSGPVYVGGVRVHPVAMPAHTYAANSDTYWDVDAGGAAYASAVANGAAEPAVAQGRVRVLKVVSGAGALTTVQFWPSHETIRATQPIQRPAAGDAHESNAFGWGFLARAGGFTASVVRTLASGSRSIIHGADPFGQPISASSHFVGVLINASIPAGASLTSAPVTRSTPGEDSFFLVVSTRLGLQLYRRPSTAADSWAHSPLGSASNGWDLIANATDTLKVYGGVETSTVTALGDLAIQPSARLKLGSDGNGFGAIRAFESTTVTVNYDAPNNIVSAGGWRRVLIALDSTQQGLLGGPSRLPAFASWQDGANGPFSNGLIFGPWNVTDNLLGLQAESYVYNPTASAVTIPATLTNFRIVFFTNPDFTAAA